MSNKAITWAYGQQDIKAGPRFILVTLADMADQAHSCYPGIELLTELTGYSRAAVINHINHLHEKGLVRTERRHDKDGVRTSNRYFLAYEGRFIASPEPGHEETGTGPASESTSPDSASTDLEPGLSLKEEPLDEPSEDPSDLSLTGFDLIDEALSGSAQQRQLAELVAVNERRLEELVADLDDATITQAFDAWWGTWPRKVERKAARAAYAKALKNARRTDRPALVVTLGHAAVAHAAYWRDAGRSPEHIPHAATWLNAERWTDELPTSPVTTDRRLTPAERAMQEFEHDLANRQPRQELTP